MEANCDLLSIHSFVGYASIVWVEFEPLLCEALYKLLVVQQCYWRLFVQLVQAAWTHGTILCQLLWIIVVLIPKGGGDYRGIGLLEPVWKCIEQVIDHQLDAIDLHDSLHGCCYNRGTGTAIIKAKLAQQLSYLELQPFYGVFLNLRKAFCAMDWEQCIMVLEGYGAGPWMIQLICGFLARCNNGV